jgi:hypothetical protein
VTFDQGRGRRGPDVNGLAREVAALRRKLDAHEREHERAELARAQAAAEASRLRVATRRYWVTTGVLLLGSQTVTWVLVTAAHHA